MSKLYKPRKYGNNMNILKRNKASVNYSYTKSSKKWVYFNWFIFGIILLAGFGYATTVNENTINTPQLDFGAIAGISGQASSRLLVSNQSTTLTVCSSGCDYNNIQEAINTVPLILRHPYLILISAGTYNENLWIPPTIVGDIISNTEGSVQGLKIYGENMNTVFLNSIQVSSSLGAISPSINNLTIIGTDPYSDENVSISFYGTKGAELKHINLTGNPSRNGILCYDCQLTVSDIHLGNNDLVGGIQVKHFGMVTSQDGGVHGNVSGYVYSRAGGIFITKGDTAVGDLGYLSQETSNNLTTGFLYRQEIGKSGGTLYGVNNFNNNLNLDYITLNNTGTSQGYIGYKSSSSGTYRLGTENNNAVIIVANNIDTFTVKTTGALGLKTNSSAVTCGTSTAGDLYWDNSTKKHYGCNSTAWNALY